MWTQVRFGADQGIVGIVERPDEWSDGPALTIAFPGLGQAMSEKNYFFSNLRKRLAEDGQWMVQFDYRGGGDSERELGQASIASMVRDAAEVLEETTRERRPAKIYMAGHALGAIVAQTTALLWEQRSGIPCYPIAISPWLSPLPKARALFPQPPYAQLEREGAVDSKLLIPGDDYYTLSDFNREQFDYITRLGAHLMYLHGQSIGRELLEELDRLDPLALFNQNVHGLHILCGEEDAETRRLAAQIERAEVSVFQPGSHFYRHPAAMDHAVEIIRGLLLSPAGSPTLPDSAPTLSDSLRARPKIDWRFPDRYGLSERNLDCLQLSILEVLKWKGETDPIPVFLNPFDCRSAGLQLRRSLPVLQRGWSLIQYPSLDGERFSHLLRSLIDGEGYALVHYRAVSAPFCAYYRKHDVIHWALAIAVEDEHIVLVDDAGAPAYFNGYLGKVPCSLFFETLASSRDGGAAIVQKTGSAASARETEGAAVWEERFFGLVRASVDSMFAGGGLAQLAAFADEVERASDETLRASLDVLEFDTHYFRRLRELWKTAYEQGAIPDHDGRAACEQALRQACQSWAYVMGVILKWKLQRERSFREKLTSLYRQAVQDETQWFLTLQATLEGRA